MRGMTLCRTFWEEVGMSSLSQSFPELLPRLAAGLMGEGSECFGYDDALSRDHDWGPGFCLWLSRQDEAAHGDALRGWYQSLPDTFSGRQKRPLSERINVFVREDFFARFIGRLPETPTDWLRIPEEYLAVCTNGEIFADPEGTMTAMRDQLLHQPEQVRRKKLAARCVTLMQAGQYNLPRCLARGEELAAALAVQDFCRAAASAAFLLNDRYMPFYKWMPRALRELPLLGRELSPLLLQLTAEPLSPCTPDRVATVCRLLSDTLRQEGYTSLSGQDMQQLGLDIYAQLTEPLLRRLPVLAG